MSNTALLRVNPELQRCLWLELTPARLVLMPSLLAIGLAGLHLVGTENLAEWVQYLLFFLLVLWGSRLAADAFVEEVAQGTWDVQRLSASNPWAMAVGKIFGGTAYVWYGAILCLAVLPAVPGAVNGRDAVMTVVSGVTAQATALLVVLVLHGFDATRRRGSTTLAQILGVVVAVPSLGSGAALGLVQGWGDALRWYGAEFPMADFTLVHQLVLTVWLVIAVAWMIRLQLGHAPSPWPYVAFAVYLAAFAVGFLFVGDLVAPLPVVTGVAALVVAAATYGALLASPMQVADIKRLMRATNWARRWQLVPAWVLTAALAVGLGALTVTLGGREWTLAAAALALFLRDIALVAAVRLLSGRRTALLLCVLALLLYGLLPEVTTAGGGALRAWIFPEMGAAPITLIGPWAQTLAALLLARLAWIRHRGA